MSGLFAVCKGNSEVHWPLYPVRPGGNFRMKEYANKNKLFNHFDPNYISTIKRKHPRI